MFGVLSFFLFLVVGVFRGSRPCSIVLHIITLSGPSGAIVQEKTHDLFLALKNVRLLQLCSQSTEAEHSAKLFKGKRKNCRHSVIVFSRRVGLPTAGRNSIFVLKLKTRKAAWNTPATNNSDDAMAPRAKGNNTALHRHVGCTSRVNLENNCHCSRCCQILQQPTITIMSRSSGCEPQRTSRQPRNGSQTGRMNTGTPNSGTLSVVSRVRKNCTI